MNAKHYLRLFGLSLMISAVVIFTSAVPVSCKMTEEGIEIYEGDTSGPKILAFSVQDNKSLSLVCTEKVVLSDLLVQDGAESQIEVGQCDYIDEENTVKINLLQPMLIGRNYVLEGIAKDLAGNSLSFSLPFLGFNENPAVLALNEIRTKHTTTGGVLKKAEYVELVAVKSGNLCGIELFSAGDGEEKKYSFPVMEVQEGDYITVHLRKTDEGVIVDEDSENTELSSGEAACGLAIDLWAENETPVLGETDVIILNQAMSGKIMDAVLFMESAKTDWKNAGQKKWAERAVEEGVWLSGSSKEGSAVSDYLTPIRTLCRKAVPQIDEEGIIKGGKDDWAVVTTGTPGAENKIQIYTK